jgi:hypothetical protein
VTQWQLSIRKKHALVGLNLNEDGVRDINADVFVAQSLSTSVLLIRYEANIKRLNELVINSSINATV